MNHAKVIIVGSGPAGYTAAIYAARANLEPVVFEGFYSGIAGGQLMTTTEVENFPGFEEGVTGPDLVMKLRKQAEKFGTKFLQEDVLSIEKTERGFVVKAKATVMTCYSVIIATGARAKTLDIKGAREGEFWQKGVTACAVCDGASPIFRNGSLFVIGGGDSAVEEAIFLTKYAKHVYIVHRRDSLRASKIMAARAEKNEKITILWNTVIQEVRGEKFVSSVVLHNVQTNETEEKEANGVFFAIGHQPNTDFLEGLVKLDEDGYIVTESGSTYTSVDGIFAAGDVQDKHYRQAVTAAGSGCMSAMDAERWLSEVGKS